MTLTLTLALTLTLTLTNDPTPNQVRAAAAALLPAEPTALRLCACRALAGLCTEVRPALPD